MLFLVGFFFLTGEDESSSEEEEDDDDDDEEEEDDMEGAEGKDDGAGEGANSDEDNMDDDQDEDEVQRYSHYSIGSIRAVYVARVCDVVVYPTVLGSIRTTQKSSECMVT